MRADSSNRTRSDYVESNSDPLITDIRWYKVISKPVFVGDTKRSGTLVLEFKSVKCKWIPILRTSEYVRERYNLETRVTFGLTDASLTEGNLDPNVIFRVVRDSTEIGYIANQMPFDEDTVFRVERVWNEEPTLATQLWTERGKCFIHRPAFATTGECPAPIPFMPACNPNVLRGKENLVVDIETTENEKLTCVSKYRNGQLVLIKIRSLNSSVDFSKPRVCMSTYDTFAKNLPEEKLKR